MDTHLSDLPLPLPQDPMTMERINVRARAFQPDLTAAFHSFDASRFEWLAEQLREAGRFEIARLADEWALEHRQTAEKLTFQAEGGAA